MEKTIARWGFWLGIACVIVAIAWKGGNVFGLWRALPPTPAQISYWSFFNAGILFFATSIASACRVWLKSLSKDVGVRKRPVRESLEKDEPERRILLRPETTRIDMSCEVLRASSADDLGYVCGQRSVGHCYDCGLSLYAWHTATCQSCFLTFAIRA